MRNVFGLRAVAVGAAIFTPWYAWAQEPREPSDEPPPPRQGRPAPGPRGGEDGRPGMPPPRGALMDALDTDRDGDLSEVELKAAPKAFRSLDTNHDGVIDRAELRPGRPGGPEGPQAGPGERRPRGGPGREPGGPEGRGPGGPGGGPSMGEVLPPFVREELTLSPAQRKQIEELEAENRSRLKKILNPEQAAQFEELLRSRGPGGPPEGPGGPPEGDEPPPRRPRRPR